jgi:hypothetical protein
MILFVMVLFIIQLIKHILKCVTYLFLIVILEENKLLIFLYSSYNIS